MEETRRLGDTRPADARLLRSLEDIEGAAQRGDYAGAVEQISRAAELFVEWGFDLPLDRLEGLLRFLDAHEPDHPWILYHLAWVWSTQRRHSLALVTLKRAEQRFGSLLEGEELRRARFLCKMAAGVVHEREGLFEEARESIRQALEVGGVRARQGPRSVSEQRWTEHDPSGMISFWLDALHVYEEMGLSASAARACHNLGTRLLDRGEPIPARRYLEKAWELKLGGGSRMALANTLNSLGQVERHLGLTERAAQHLGEALRLGEDLGHETLRSYVLNNLAELHRDQGKFDAAAEKYQESLEIKQRMENVFGLAHTYASQADLLLLVGEPSEARAVAERAVALRVPAPDPVENARLLSTQARTRLADDEPAGRVAEDLRVLTADLETYDTKGELAVALWWLAACLLRMDDHLAAGRSMAKALDLAAEHRLEHLLALHVAVCPEVLRAGLIDSDDYEVASTLEAVVQAKPWESRPRHEPSVRPVLGSRLFGGLEVFLDEKEVPLATWRSKKAVSLLALLVHHRGDPVHREQAMEWLWPEGDPERSGRNLNVALTALRRGLERVDPRGSSVLERQGSFYRILPDALGEIDVLRFLDLHAEAGRLAQAEDVKGALSVTEEALDLAAGEYLASEPYAEWAATERAHLQEMVIDLRLRAAEWNLELERPSRAAKHAGDALARERWRERAWSALMRAHAARGDRAAALRTFEECESTLEDELGIGPSPELIDLARSLRR
ncbi:MAG: tetratricopeptide repeat protein [Actinobacteria bacterium]|nr:tetratricopeptide repeat protein [Actinomycetota bacterium]